MQIPAGGGLSQGERAGGVHATRVAGGKDVTFNLSSTLVILSFQDTYSGLMGPLITCREGVLNEKGRRSDVDYEFALLFLVFDENESWYLDDNIKKYLNKDPRDFRRTDDFEESNKMHGMQAFRERLLLRQATVETQAPPPGTSAESPLKPFQE